MWAILRGGPWIFAALAIGVVIWFLAPSPAVRELPEQPAEPWKVPLGPKQSTGIAVEGLGKSSLWGVMPDAASAVSLNDPDWRILGIVKAGKERFVLVKVDGQPERRLTVDDKLPGGSVILGIGDDSLCVLVNGARRKLGIYKTDSQVL